MAVHVIGGNAVCGFSVSSSCNTTSVPFLPVSGAGLCFDLTSALWVGGAILCLACALALWMGQSPRFRSFFRSCFELGGVFVLVREHLVAVSVAVAFALGLFSARLHGAGARPFQVVQRIMGELRHTLQVAARVIAGVQIPMVADAITRESAVVPLLPEPHVLENLLVVAVEVEVAGSVDVPSSPNPIDDDPSVRRGLRGVPFRGRLRVHQAFSLVTRPGRGNAAGHLPWSVCRFAAAQGASF